MGLISYRYIARTREVHVFPDIPPDWGPMSFLKPSKAQNIEMSGIRARRPLYITPYVLGCIGQTWDLNDEETSYRRSDDPTRDIGLDLKYGITNNLTMET